MTRALSWLQLSDIHLRAADEYNQNVVLDSLLSDIGERIATDDITFDFVFLTGDIAFSGAPEEYQAAEIFVAKLAATTGVGVDSIYCVPGNHDVERARIVHAGHALSSRDMVTKVLADSILLQDFLQRQFNYQDFVKRVFPWTTSLADHGISYTVNRRVNEIAVSILGLNSAWVSGAEDDHGKLVVGERQVRNALKRVHDPAILIALMHHPLSHLADFDAADVQGLLNTRCDFVLHGHIHDFGAVTLRSPDSEVFYLAAGAGYQQRTEILSYNYVRLDFDTGNAKLFLRRFSDRQGGFWSADTLMYRSAPGGVLTFPLPERTSRRQRTADIGPMHMLAEELTAQPPARSPDVEPALVVPPPPRVPVPDPPNALVDDILARRCILFAGSGASVDAQLPSWPQLVRDLIDQGEAAGQIDSDARRELDDLVTRGFYFPAAEYCRDKIGLHQFASYLQSRLSDVERSSQTHRLLSQIPFHAAITTNYDKLIEYSHSRHVVILPDLMDKLGASGMDGVLKGGSFPVIKINGSLEDVDSIVLTQGDLRRLSFRRPKYIELIRGLLTDYTIFFYGSGFVDPNVNFLLQEILTLSRGTARLHYAVMPEQGPIMRAFWRSNYNIRVTSYQLWEDSHVAAKAFLEKLVVRCSASAIH